MSDPIIKVLPLARTAKEFLAALRPSADAWEGPDPTQTGWFFRGQASSRWALRPSVYRRRPSISKLLASNLRFYKKRYVDELGYSWRDWQDWVLPKSAHVSTPVWQRRLSTAALHALSHAALVRDFVLLADRAGHGMVRPDFLWHLTNRKEHPNALAGFFAGDTHYDDLSAFAIAQHHGIPTGLLDWTYNPLVAAFFAAESALKHSTGSHIAVWAIRSEIFLHDLRELRRLTVPPERVPFLDAQDGLFTWSPEAYHSVLEHGRYPTVEDLVNRIGTATLSGRIPFPLLQKLSLPTEEVVPLLQLLWREQITKGHLMPTYDNVTESMYLRATLLDR